MTKKVKKLRYNKGTWVGSRRCMNCNSITLLKNLEGDRKKFENSGKYTNMDGDIIDCMCDKGWFHTSGTISS